MSEESDNESEISFLVSNIRVESEQDELLPPIRSNEEQPFIYNEDFNKLICVGVNCNDIPLNILHDYSLKTKILDLSGNNFRSLSCLENFPNLEELILDDNELDDVQTIFPKLPNLHTLMINKNRFQEISRLGDQLRQAYPSLTYLSLLGNEACPYRITSTDQFVSDDVFTEHYLEEEYRRYRHLLIFCLPTLKFLDSREITLNERHMAMTLGGSIAETKKKNTMT